MRRGTEARPANPSRQDDPGTQAAFTVLLWLATCDGPLKGPELAKLARIASRGNALLGAFAGAVERSSHLSFIALRESFKQVMAMPLIRRGPLLKAAVRVALADGELTPPEQQALRLIADACVGGVDGERALASELSAMGRRLNPPSDLSDPDWWTQKEARESPRKPPAGWTVASTLALREVRDLAILGLGPGADGDAIRSAFRRIAMVLHPDRLLDASEDARAEAARTLQNAREAHDRLTTG